jgi:hypothetical protein
MSTRFLGGIISATPPTVSTSSAPGVWSLEQALQYIKAGNWPVVIASDPYFKYVTMLLHGDGTNGAQNNTFLDSSTNNFTITRNGNTTQGSFSPYGSNWSNYFDGSTAWFSIASNAAFGMGTGDCTLECWYFPNNSTVGVQTLIDIRTTNSGVPVVIGVLGTGAVYAYNGTTYSGGTVTNNAWNHIAFVRNGGGSNNCKLYLNGSQVAQFTDANDWGASDSCAIGRNTAFNGEFAYGYISNARVVKGTAVYTGNFTPSTTPLTAISGTSLLTCQSNRFIDNSTNNFAITVNGTPSVQRFSPFSPSDAYSTSVIGGSGYFDGSGDFLTTPQNAAFNIGTGPFTVECFIYWNGTTLGGGGYGLINLGNGANSGGPYTGWGLILDFDYSGKPTWYRYDGTIYSYRSSTAPTANQWIHIAVSRNSSNTLSMWMNGTRVYTGTVTQSFNNVNSDPLNIGYRFDGAPGNTHYFPGYISNARVVVGTDVYGAANSTITVPTAPLTAISGTSLLTNFTNGGIFDNAMMNNLETVGNAQISTSVVKFGSGSISYPSTGSYLYTAWKPNLEIGAGDFTIEFWMYGTSGSPLFCWSVDWHFGMTWNYGGANANRIGVWMSSNGSSWNIFNADGGGNGISTGTVSPNTWTHVALVRNGSAWTLYLNGTSAWTGTSSATVVTRSTDIFRVGGPWPAGGPVDYVGFLDDFRFTRGYARYTANFTPPTQAFSNN